MLPQWLHGSRGRAVLAKLSSRQHATLGLRAPVVQPKAPVCWSLPLPRGRQLVGSSPVTAAFGSPFHPVPFPQLWWDKPENGQQSPFLQCPNVCRNRAKLYRVV